MEKRTKWGGFFPFFSRKDFSSKFIFTFFFLIHFAMINGCICKEIIIQIPERTITYQHSLFRKKNQIFSKQTLFARRRTDKIYIFQ